MAPSAYPISVVFDFRGQIVENCEFFTGKDDYISIITHKEPSGEFKAAVLRSNNDNREALMAAGPCKSVQQAIEQLHDKTTEAVQLYIKTNGYCQPRDLRKDDGDDSDTESVVSSRSAASSVALSLWDSDEEIIDTPVSSSRVKSPDKPAGNTRKSRKPKARDLSKSRGDDSDNEPRVVKIVNPINRPPPGTGRYPPPPPPPCWNGPPPPPPSYRPPHQPNGSVPILHSQAPSPGASGPHPPISNMMPPGPPGMRSMSQPPQGPSTRAFDVRLAIKWLNHSEKLVLESSRASVRALQETALNYVRSHMNAFDNVTPLDHSPSKIWHLRASVKQAFFGQDAYDMTTYRTDDLIKLFNVVGANDIPRFKIEVDYIRPGPPPGAVVHMP